jgi:uncharacterized phage protein (TIGR02220 family)
MYTKVEDLFWRDEKLKKCSIDARYIFVYLLSNPHRNILGFYYMPKMYAMFDLGMVEERFDKGLGELLDNGFIKHDEASNIVFVKRFLKYNKLDNKNQVASAIKRIDELPNTELFEDLLKTLCELEIEKYDELIEAVKQKVSLDFLKGFERVSEGYAKQETETEEETEEVKEEVKEAETVSEAEKEAETESGKPDDVSVDETVEVLSADPDETENAKPVGKVINDVVDFLNSTVGTSYRASSKKTKSLIKARMNDGYVLDDFKMVIMKKSTEWIGTDFEKFLRPETLFGTKFESYLNQKSQNGGESFKDALNEFIARGEESFV